MNKRFEQPKRLYQSLCQKLKKRAPRFDCFHRLHLERLENRLALSVTISSGIIIDGSLNPWETLPPKETFGSVAFAEDKFVISPTESDEGFEISIAPILLDPKDVGPFDLSTPGSLQQRYEIPADSNSEILFRVDTDKSYLFSAIGSPDLGDIEEQTSLGYRSFDIDRNEIEVLHVGKHKSATDTVLVSDVNPGDNFLLTEDATGWSNEIIESAESRSLAWYGYTDSKGHVYSDFSYTRNIASDFQEGVWSAGGITYDPSLSAYRIALNQPWSGPSLAAGSAIRNATSGLSTSTPFPLALTHRDRWEAIDIILQGEWQSGERDEFSFRPGTAFVQPTATNPEIWNNIYFGLEEAFLNVTPASITPDHSQSFELEVDVLSDGNWGAFTDLLAGDFNQDGIVDQYDYVVWRDAYETTTAAPFFGADANGDQVVDSLDYEIWASNFGEVASETSLPGDFNFDGAVDAADYTVWRDQGSAAYSGDYQIWRDNFGNRAAITSLPGDYNLDGSVDAADYTVWRDTIGNEGPAGSGADGNGDGVVNQEDHQIWVENYGAKLSVVIRSAEAAYGQVSLVGEEGTQRISYQSPAWFVGTDRIEYVLVDTQTGKSVKSAFTIEINGSNYESDYAARTAIEEQASSTNNLPPSEAQVYYSDDYSTAKDLPLVVGAESDVNLLSLFEDPEEGTLVPQLISGTSNGILKLNYDGSFEYTPDQGFVGFDDFQVEIFDGVNTVVESIRIEVFATQNELVLDRLHSLSFAMHVHELITTNFPIASEDSYFDDEGNPYLSWRVHLLPYLGLNSLYERFNLDEPWYSANNYPLADLMPNYFRDPADNSDSNTTRFQTFTGPDAPFGFRADGANQVGPRYNQFVDASNTLLIAESGQDAAVVWTQPADMVFDINDPKAALGTITSDRIHVAAIDGSRHSIPASISPEDFSALVTRNGNEAISIGTFHRQHQEISGEVEPDPKKVSLGNLSAIGLSMINYINTFTRLPTNTLLSERGDSTANVRGLSWRVHLLPYLGHTNLYHQFNFDEPWDSPNNLPLLDKMPDVFRSIGDSSDSNTTRIVRPEGILTGHYNWPGVTTGYSYRSFIDGLSQTILALEAGTDQAVPWTKPIDPSFDLDDPLAVIGDLTQESFNVFFVDGTVAALPSDISANDFSALVTRASRDVVDHDTVTAKANRENGIAKSHAQRVEDFENLVQANFYQYSQDARLTGNHFDAAGTPLLSWRVELLPSLGHGPLYALFNHDEPWDSPHNLSLLPLMPDVFRSIGDPPDSTTTRVIKFTGLDNTPYPSFNDLSKEALRISDITDGSANTIAFLEAGPEVAEPWTKPVDRLLPEDPYTVLGTIGEGFIVAKLDGKVEFFSGQMPASELRAWITHNGNESLIETTSLVLVENLTATENLITEEKSTYGSSANPQLEVSSIILVDPIASLALQSTNNSTNTRTSRIALSDVVVESQDQLHDANPLSDYDLALLLLDDFISYSDSFAEENFQEVFDSSTTSFSEETLFDGLDHEHRMKIS